MKKTPEEIQRLLKTVVTLFDKEDMAVRQRQIRTWRQLKLFWEGFQKAWYSEVAHDWRIWDETAQGDDTGQSYYDKPVNVFRAYLESIIAALSVTIPPVKCYPDDADNTLDLLTAKAGDKIAQLVYKHNDVSLLWLHALFIFCTEGMVGCYSYAKSDDSYGTYEKKTHEDIEEEHSIVRCPACGHNIEDNILNPGGVYPDAPAPEPSVSDFNPEEVDGIPPPNFNLEGSNETNTGNEGNEERLELEKDEFGVDDSDVDIQNKISSGTELCPSCQAEITPQLITESFIVTRLVGTTHEPKTRICMEAYGGLYIKVPNYAKNQSECPYLLLSHETHYANAIERYDLIDSATLRSKIKGSTGPKDPYEEWGRLNPQYNGIYPENIVTIRQAWLRPAAFNVLDDEDCAKLKKHYPNGAHVTLVNDEFAEACNESLDDHWTLTYNPMADYIHHDPIGLLLVSLQELTNDMISLTVQTIEHGIPQTFADPGVLNFDAYRQMESVPGGIYEAVPKSGKSLADGFHEVKTATLSSEVLPFSNQLQSLAQLVSGALPSLFGGQAESGSNTASEYSMSRAQALQRLQNNWKMLMAWWKTIFGKVVPMYIKEVQEDERDVQRGKDGNFINVFIRRAELEGKIGKIELEASENLPMTWSQRKDVVMQLLQAGNPEILAMLGQPENLPLIREAIGLDNFYVPGEDDKDMQFDEIKQLLNTEPIFDPTTGMEMPSVEIDVDYDDHITQFEICRKWIISEAGRQAKVENPQGYRNVLLHGKMHLAVTQGMPQAMAQGDGTGAAPLEKPNEKLMPQQAPITGESDVPTVQ